MTWDKSDTTILESTGMDGGETVVVCVLDDGAATRIVKAIHRPNFDCRIVVRCRYQGNTKKLKKASATTIVAEESEATMALMRLQERPKQNVELSTIE